MSVDKLFRYEKEEEPRVWISVTTPKWVKVAGWILGSGTLALVIINAIP